MRTLEFKFSSNAQVERYRNLLRREGLRQIVHSYKLWRWLDGVRNGVTPINGDAVMGQHQSGELRMALEEPDAVDASAATAAPLEIQVAFAHAATVSNRVLLTMSASGGRLSFLEIGPDGTPQFRAAVFLGFGELLGLQQLIGNMLQLPPGAPDGPKK